MTPRQFEEITGDYFEKDGYKITLTSFTNDYGADLFAEKGTERIVVQAKMYGKTSRKVNRKCIMELHGVKDYFECTKAVLSTDGELMPDAIVVAKKLRINIINPLTESLYTSKSPNTIQLHSFFDKVWKEYIIPLEGQSVFRDNGDSNKIVKVDWAHVQRISSKGKKSNIEIDIFKQTINHLEKHGSITREHINQNYDKRASSGIVLILSQVPLFKLTKNPLTLHYNKSI